MEKIIDEKQQGNSLVMEQKTENQRKLYMKAMAVK